MMQLRLRAKWVRWRPLHRSLCKDNPVSGQPLVLVVDIEGEGVGGDGDYPEEAIGNGRKIVPRFSLRIVIILTEEDVISLFDIGREGTTQKGIEVPFLRCVGLFHFGTSDRH